MIKIGKKFVISAERGNNMTEFNVTIGMRTDNEITRKKLEMVIKKDGNTAVYDYSDGYDVKEKYMLEQIAEVMAESLDCSCVYKSDLKKDKYLVRWELLMLLVPKAKVLPK